MPALGEGEALLEVRYLGIDPTIRGWLDERGNYMPGVAIGECVRSNGVGVVVETNNPEEYPLGRAFMHLTGWQQYCVVQSNPFPPITMVPEGVAAHRRARRARPHRHHRVRRRARGREAATGRDVPASRPPRAASGSIAGQIAKMQGARVIGIAGSAEKCAWVVDDLGFDACIDYKTEDVAARLKELAPKGVDVFFDNVGGELLDTVLRRLAMRARVVLCGDISTYDLDEPAPPLHNLRYLMGKRARMEGFNTLDHWDHYARGGRAARRVAGRGQAGGPRATCSKASTARPKRWCASSRATTSASSSCVRLTPDHTVWVCDASGHGLDFGEALRSRRSALGVGLGRRDGRAAAPVQGMSTRNVAPCAGRGLDLGAAAVRLGDRGDDREAEPGAAARARARRVGAPEPLEHARRVFGRHARAVVAHFDHRVRRRDSSTRTSTGVSRRRVRARVLEQVREHLAQAVLVAVHDDRAVRRVDRPDGPARRDAQVVDRGARRGG